MDNSIINLLEQKSSFMASSKEYSDCDRVIIGIPMDTTTSFRPGTRLAPNRVREVSDGIEEYSFFQDKSLEEIHFFDAGDVVIPFGNVGESLRRVEMVANAFLADGKKIFAIGGEHLVSLPLIKRHHAYFPDLVVLQMDAHADLREEYRGENLSHATVMRHIVEQVGTKNLYQLGIRSATREETVFARENTCMYPSIENITSLVEEIRGKIADRALYITLDIDFLDPAFAPGTGTPEPGGYSSRELFQLIHELAGLNVVGFDLVEISPPYEKGDNTSILGAKILREALLAF